MLVTPRTWQQLQVLQDASRSGPLPAVGWRVSPDTVRHREKMLLLHQVGSVKVGEVVRYTLTYTPSRDRILPSPSHLHVKIRNTSAIPLRAAYLHGPYTLYTACYPATFDPNHKREQALRDGVPDFEPNLKAAGSWSSQLTVPENIRETASKANVRRTTDGSIPSVTWIIEISSQVIFSLSAAVHFELLVGRDEKSVELGFSSLTGQAAATPGQLEDHQQSKKSKAGHGAAQPKGVFSHAISLVVDDTESLWNKPALPEWNDEGRHRGKRRSYPDPGEQDNLTAGHETTKTSTAEEDSTREGKARKRKRIHLVVLTHGLHSNLGADMLYLKESIDAAAKEARESNREKKAARKAQDKSSPDHTKHAANNQDARRECDNPSSSTAPLSGGQDDLGPTPETDDEEEEEVIVRGFPGNATRTEKGIQYLGKRLAKWILMMTFPDQPFLPAKKSVGRKISRVFSGDQTSDKVQGPQQHSHSSIHRPEKKPKDLAYKITSISFISHSLGGLTQTYAIAYIHKHSPDFFNIIKPINFVAMAAPFLGLSNENPLYVRFALDFGLVGRTGQDLGLTWRAPTMVRSGWGAMIAGIGSDGQRAQRQPDPGSKPLLRILPTGHTHQVLKLFRNRTVYSNVVNDGIVPLRTSCLLFLDWSGLGRVEKARRENGVVGTMAGWGWAEITGANKSSNRHLSAEPDGEAWSHSDMSGDEDSSQRYKAKAEVPQPEEDAVRDDTTTEGKEARKDQKLPNSQEKYFEDEAFDVSRSKESSPQQPINPFTGLLSLLRPSQSKSQSHHHSPKQTRIYRRSQTIKGEAEDETSQSSESSSRQGSTSAGIRPGVVRGDSILEDPNNVFAPPKTTIFEAAGDLLNPPLPTREFLTNPQGRPRTIFHDRVYHPEDIPPPPAKKRNTLRRTFSSESRQSLSRSGPGSESQPVDVQDTSGMKVEEKIARAYHHELSWRKVLVRLEPDAHNNMIVRRMFANAYGWPVIKHLVDTHFADTYAATTADADEPNKERAKPASQAVGKHGEEVETDRQTRIQRTDSEAREAKDSVSELSSIADLSMSSSIDRPGLNRKESVQWDDSMFDITDDEDDMGNSTDLRHRGHIFIPEHHQTQHHHQQQTNPSDPEDQQPQTPHPEIADSLTLSPPPVESPDKQHLGSKSFFRSPPPGGTSSVGLGKSVAESIKSPPRRKVSSSKGRNPATEGYGGSEGGVGNVGVDGNGEGELRDEVTRIGIEDGL